MKPLFFEDFNVFMLQSQGNSSNFVEIITYI